MAAAAVGVAAEAATRDILAGSEAATRAGPCRLATTATASGNRAGTPATMARAKSREEKGTTGESPEAVPAVAVIIPPSAVIIPL